MSNEELTAEISALKERIEQLELDIMLLKVVKITSQPPVYPDYAPWVAPKPIPSPYWGHGTNVLYC